MKVTMIFALLVSLAALLVFCLAIYRQQDLMLPLINFMVCIVWVRVESIAND